MEPVTVLDGCPKACPNCPSGMILSGCWDFNCFDVYFHHRIRGWHPKWEWDPDLKDDVTRLPDPRFPIQSLQDTNPFSTESSYGSFSESNAEGGGERLEGQDEEYLRLWPTWYNPWIPLLRSEPYTLETGLSWKDDMTVTDITDGVDGPNSSGGMGSTDLGNNTPDNAQRYQEAIRKLQSQRCSKKRRALEGQGFTIGTPSTWSGARNHSRQKAETRNAVRGSARKRFDRREQGPKTRVKARATSHNVPFYSDLAIPIRHSPSRAYDTVGDVDPNAASRRPIRYRKLRRAIKRMALGVGIFLVVSGVPTVAAEYPLQGVAHFAAGTSIAASISVLPLRNGGDLVEPEYWVMVAYGVWGVSFVALLVCELVRRPEQKKLLVGTALFASLNLLGTLTQSAPSTLEGVLCWGPTALTVSLFVVGVVMDSVSRRETTSAVAALAGVHVHVQEPGKVHHR